MASLCGNKCMISLATSAREPISPLKRNGVQFYRGDLSHLVSTSQFQPSSDTLQFSGLSNPFRRRNKSFSHNPSGNDNSVNIIDKSGFIRLPAFPWRLNKAGFIQAGHVLKLIDINGSEAAFRYIQSTTPDDQKKPVVVTASVDRTNFIAPIHKWEYIRMESDVTQVWNSSLESRVKVYAENMLSGEIREVATSHLIFAALDLHSRKKAQLQPLKPTTPEEVQSAKMADLRKANRKEEGNVAPFISIEESDSPEVVERMMTPEHANGHANVFGGIILDIIDEAGAKMAEKQTYGLPVVGVRLDRMSFIAPTYIGEKVEAKAIVTKTWRTSMEVQVEVEAVNPNTGDRRKVASSYLVYVKIEPSDGRAVEVPPYLPKTANQKKRAEAADARRAIRKQEENKAEDVPVSADVNEAHDKGLWERFRHWMREKQD